MPAIATIRILSSASDLSEAFLVMRGLRPHVESLQDFTALLARQAVEGYTLAGGYAADRLVTLAGYRLTCTLARGPHLFVDDLATAATDRGKGYGLQMIEWLRTTARNAGVARIYLDSRDTAVRFYEQAGFTFLTSRPCWIDV
jgi:GNAT superfamily N-acetyltransferase